MSDDGYISSFKMFMKENRCDGCKLFSSGTSHNACFSEECFHAESDEASAPVCEEAASFLLHLSRILSQLSCILPYQGRSMMKHLIRIADLFNIISL